MGIVESNLPEQTHKTQEMEPHKCVFCEIIAGKEESSIIVQTNSSTSFMSLEGHPLVVPKQHIDKDIEKFPDIADVFDLAISLLPSVRKVYNASGIKLQANLGEAAGQEVMHFHFHIIPIIKDENGKSTRFSYESREQMNIIAQALHDDFISRQSNVNYQESTQTAI